MSAGGFERREPILQDEELVRRFQRGETDAFDPLYRRYRDQALRMAYLITGSRSDAEDVVQETFVSCYRQLGRLREPSRFRPWLLRSLTRAAWRACCKAGREEPVPEFFESACGAGESALEPVLRRETADRLYRALRTLDPKRRTIVVLYYWDEMSVREIARVTGCLEGTVKSRLHSARTLLRQALENDEGVIKEVHTHEKGYAG